MNYDFSKFKRKADATDIWFKEEIAVLRTGRASPMLVENIKVDYYGTKTPLKSMATINTEDARTLRVKPWGADAIVPIEQAVKSAGMGLQAILDKDAVRIIFPDLTEERRKSLLKILSEKLEEARISLRKEREEIWRDIQDKEHEGKISEDEKFRFKDELQKMLESINDKLEAIAAKKEQEIKF